MHNRNFLMKQRAFLKLYLLHLIEKNYRYGSELQDKITEEFKAYGYIPRHSEIYKALHELTLDGILKREKVLKDRGNPEAFQEIVIYRFTEEGRGKAEAYKKTLRYELERCIKMLQKCLRDVYK